jgi:hypothetical protein
MIWRTRMRTCERRDQWSGLDAERYTSARTPSDETSTHFTAFTTQTRITPHHPPTTVRPHLDSITPASSSHPPRFLSSRHLLHSARRWASMGFFSRFTSASSALGWRSSTCIYAFPALSHCHYLSQPRGSPHKHRSRLHGHLEA